jgi:hypothetical protein
MRPAPSLRHIVIFSVLAILSFSAASLCQSKIERQFAARVSKDRLLAQVRDLVRFGPRTGGTPSGDKAASYVAQKFKEAGFKPIIQKDPPRLAFQLKGWTLGVQEPRKLHNLIRHEWLGAYSPSVPSTQAGLMYLRDPEGVSKLDVDGKAVLLSKPISQRTYQQLEDAGARCLLLISPALEGAYSDWAMITDLAPSTTNRIPLFNLSYNNGVKLERALNDTQKVTINFSTEAETDSGRPKTVVATLEGESDRYYLLCAHGDSDSGGPGADDNASGVSGVLETARVLKELVRSHTIPKPKISIRFAVWGTEIYSTEEYVRLHKHDLKDIAGVLNFDEIGTGATRNCLYFESNEVKYNEKLLRTLEQVGEDYVGKNGFWTESTTNPSQGGTDSYVFFPHELRRLKVPDAEIPSTTIYTGAWNELKPIPQTPGWTSKAWHGPADTVYVDYSAYYQSSLDIPERTTEREPFNMIGAVKATGIALLRLAW